MPKIAISSENKIRNASEYPKLRLDQNERVRILAIETEPEWGYTHTLRAPVLDEYGKPVMQKTTRRSGEVVEEPATDFVGRHLCIGSIDVISQEGVDVKGCPVCAESRKSSVVLPPERRFAMHVIRYKTKPGTFEIIPDPFFVEMVVWDYTESRFSMLVNLAETWGDLRKHDLLLGPCTNKGYQKYDLAIAPNAEWMASKERMQVVKKVYEENKCPDLSAFIGRRLSREQVMQDLDKVLEKNRQAFGGPEPEPVSPAATAAAMDEGDLASLLSPGQQEAAKPAPAQEQPKTEDPWSSESFAIFEEPVAGTPASPAPAKPQAESQELNLDNIDDLFG